MSELKAILSGRISGYDAKALAKADFKEELFQLLFDPDKRTSDNAAWVLTHKAKGDINQLPQRRLIDLALSTHDTSLRRLTLCLIERQGIPPEHIRTDFLDFCLRHMVMLEEPSGVRGLCMKLGYSMCSHYPELAHEFSETLNLMHAEHYKPGVKYLINKLNKDPQHE